VPLPPLPPAAAPPVPVEVPLIPEADSALLLAIGLGTLGLLALSARRRSPP